MQQTRDASHERRAGREAPGEPWRLRPDWAAGRVRDEAGRYPLALLLAWSFCFVWFGGLGLFAYALRGAEDNDPESLILGGFAVAGLLPLAMAVRETRLRLRFGRSVFMMASVPGVVGGRLEGVIELPVRLELGSRLRVVLTCWQRSLSRNFAEHVVWEAAAVDTSVSGGPPARVPVAFEIPFESPASDLGRPLGGIFWTLSLEGREKARGIEGRFVVPVYVTAASRSAQDGGPAVATTRPASSDVIVEASSPGVLGLRFRFGPVGWFFVVFLPFALPIALIAARQLRWDGEPLEIPWTGAIIVTVVVVAFAATTHIMEPMGVTVGAGQVTLLRGYRGWFPPHRIPVSEVMAVNLKECVNHLQQVVLRTRKSEDVSVSQVTTVMEARWIAQEVRRAIFEAGGKIAI